jgi:uncharacterized protein (UPF0332 family)
MDKIVWCLRKEHGLSFVEPNQNLADAYLVKAGEALASMRINKVRDWKISTAYYTVYFSLYAILMKIGIKCEIHSCTFEFARRFLTDYFTGDEFSFFEDALEARINAQYYVDRKVPDEQYERLLERTPEMLVKCRGIVQQINEKKINEIRAGLKARLK